MRTAQFYRFPFLAGLLLALMSSAGAQMMPGAEPEKKEAAKPDGAPASEGKPRAAPKPQTVQEQKEAVTRQIDEEGAKGFRKFYLTFFGEHSPYRGVLLAIVTLIVFMSLKKYLTTLMRQYAESRAHKGENVERFMKTWNALWKFILGVLVLIAMSGSLKLLGLSVAFFGMILGWSLQAPVTGLAAWLMIILKRPFKIGDRVIIAGIIGDVMDITLTHVILNQVGGTVGGEEPSGRAVLIPNAILFGHIIMNYTLQESKYMLDEVPIRLTFDSDCELAEQIMLDAAREVMAEVIKDTGQEPFMRYEFFDAGVLARLRYQTIPARRQELSSRIVERTLSEFKAHYPKVKFCYPRSVVRYRWEDEECLQPSGDDQKQDVAS